MISVQVSVQLQCLAHNDERRKVSVNIKQTKQIIDLSKNDDTDRKFIMCNLLLQLGKLLGVGPHAPSVPSVRVNSMFNELYEKWNLQCKEKNTNYTTHIDRLEDINDGDELILYCGDYFSYQNTAVASVLELIPSKCKVVSVSLVSAETAAAEKNKNSATAAANTERAGNAKESCDNLDSNSNHYSSAQNGDNNTEKEATNNIPSNSTIISLVDTLYTSANKDTVTMGHIKQRVVRHFGWVSWQNVDINRQALIKERIKGLISGKVIVPLKGGAKNDDSDQSSEKKKAEKEVINVDDIDSDNEDNFFWEYDASGNIKTWASNMNEPANYSDSDMDVSVVGEDDVISISSGSSSSVEDVTDGMLAEQKKQEQKMKDEAEEIDDDSECDKKQKAVPKRKQSRGTTSNAKRRKTKATESSIEVLINDEDIPACPGAKATQNDKGAQDGDKNSEEVDHAIKQRIVKLLNTGFHDESNEHEARNAMKLARRLCERYNLDQAVLLQERGDGSLNDFSTTTNDDGSALQGGIVTTKIRNRKRGRPLSSLPRWLDFLVAPICQNFHVEAFKTIARGTMSRLGECSVTFYGIKVNAQLAAYAFKIASERISLMAAKYEPPMISSSGTETRTARLSYALGIVNGLKMDVDEGLQKEEEMRNEKLRRAQSAARSGEVYHEDGSDEDSGACIIHAEGEDTNTQEDTLERLERENTAHLALVDHNKKIAEDILKSKNIKVRSARKKQPISFNRHAYDKGVVDAKEIDLNQQSINK